MPDTVTLIVAATADSAAAHAAEAGLADGWRHVTTAADVRGAVGVLLFAPDWRDAWPDNTELEDDGPTPLILAAHAEPGLVVELAV